jgi:hypothetical protein
MRYAIVTSLLSLLTGALSAAAQTTASADALVRAAVANRPISMTVAGETNFGTVTGADVVFGSGTAILNPNAPGGGQSTAMYNVSGEPNTAVNVSCQGLVFLNLSTNPVDQMAFESNVAQSPDPGNQAGAAVGCGAGGFFTAVLNTIGGLHMWLGGRLHVNTNSPPTAGAYSGMYTLTVSY